METIKLTVQERTEKGDGPSRRLRAAGRLPGVVYGKGIQPTLFSVDTNSLHAAMADGHNVVMELSFGAERESAKKDTKGRGEALYTVVKELQVDPVRRVPLHVDLYRVDLKEEIEAPVSIELVGTPAGVRDGGVVDWGHREVLVRGLPGNIPASISLDVSGLLVGHHLTVAALVAPTGVTIIDDLETVVVTVIPPRVEEEAEEAGEVEAEPETSTGGAKSGE